MLSVTAITLFGLIAARLASSAGLLPGFIETFGIAILTGCSILSLAVVYFGPSTLRFIYAARNLVKAGIYDVCIVIKQERET